MLNNFVGPGVRSSRTTTMQPQPRPYRTLEPEAFVDEIKAQPTNNNTSSIRNYVFESLPLVLALPPNDLRRRIFETEVQVLFTPNAETETGPLCLDPEWEHCDDLPSEQEMAQLLYINRQRKRQLKQQQNVRRQQFGINGGDASAVDLPQSYNPLDYTLNLYPVSFLNYVSCHLKYSCNSDATIDTLPLLKRIGSESAYGEVYTTSVNPLGSGSGNNANVVVTESALIQRPRRRRLRQRSARNGNNIGNTSGGLGDVMVLKTFKRGSALRQSLNATHELFVGMTCCNEVRQDCPNFIYTYGFLQCSDIPECVEKNPNPDYTYPVLMIEFVENAKSLRSMYDRFDLDDLCNVHSQTIAALGEAYLAKRFVHQDLHDENVLIQTIVNDSSVNNDQARGAGERFFDYQRGGWQVPERQYFSRLIDYGLSTAENPLGYQVSALTTGATPPGLFAANDNNTNNNNNLEPTIEFVDTLHSTLGRFHFISDLFKMLGFGLWQTSITGTQEERQQYEVVQDVNFEVLRNLYSYLQQDAANSSEPNSTSFYLLLMLIHAVYRLLYPSRAFVNPSQPPPMQDAQFQQLIADPLQLSMEDSVFFRQYLYVMALYELVAKHVPEQQMNALTLVDFLYPPTLEGARTMETGYIKLRGNRALIQQYPMIADYLNAVESTDIFARLRDRIGVSSYRQYDQYVTECAAYLKRALPDMNTFIQNVLLEPVSPISNADITDSFRRNLLAVSSNNDEEQ
jgi:hypothetical protein